MSTTDTIENQDPRRQKVVDHVLRFAEVLQGISQRFKGLARNLTLSGFVAAVILDRIMAHAWSWSPTVSVIVGILLVIPPLVVGWGWYVLEEASGLPERLIKWFGGAKSYAGVVVHRVQGKSSKESAGRISDLKGLAGLTYEITSLGLDASGLLGILGGSLSISNPIYLALLTVSIIAIAILNVSALIGILVIIL